MSNETAYDVMNRQNGQIVGTAYIGDDGELVRFEPKPAPEPEPEPAQDLYRIVWWQSLIQGLAQGETLEENVPREQVEGRVMHWRISLHGAVGVMVDACPMSFVPAGDNKEE